MKTCNFLRLMAVFVLVNIANYAGAEIIEIQNIFNGRSFSLKNIAPLEAACILIKDTHYSVRVFDSEQGWTMEPPYFSLEWTVSKGTKASHPNTIQFVIPREAIDTKKWEVSFLKITGNGGDGMMEEILTLTPSKIRYNNAYINYSSNSAAGIQIYRW